MDADLDGLATDSSREQSPCAVSPASCFFPLQAHIRLFRRPTVTAVPGTLVRTQVSLLLVKLFIPIRRTCSSGVFSHVHGRQAVQEPQNYARGWAARRPLAC